ncbi:MAG TPA: YidB family protein [Leptospiraceae bacterium]|nr:YidB family protein [Leptospiraceae bacterium]
MGFLDKVISAANDVAGKEGNQNLVGGVIDMLQKKGVGGIVQDLKTKGLGDLAESWIGTGENKLISPEQIKNVLGSEQLQALAQKAGVSPENASKFLGQILPGIVDKLTPQGQVPGDDPGKSPEASAGPTDGST